MTLANGPNSVGLINVANLQSSDWQGVASNDVLTLLNQVGGVTVNLQQGSNTLNLAAGVNSFADIYNVDAINGSDSADTLVVNNGLYSQTDSLVINMGDGDDTVTVGGPNAGLWLDQYRASDR